MQQARSLLQAVLERSSNVELPTVRLFRSKQKQKAIAARLSKQLVMPCRAMPCLPRRGREREVCLEDLLAVLSRITFSDYCTSYSSSPPPINNLLLSRACWNSSCVSGKTTTPGPRPPEGGSVARKPCVVIIQ